MKDIPGFEGLYQATEDGRIYSLINSKFLNPPKTDWYSQLRLCKDGVQKPFRVHRLIALTFLPNPENKKDVNHKNGIKSDNRVENLEWNTRSENQIHAFRVLNRAKSKGFTHPKSKTVIDLLNGVFYDSVSEAATAKCLTKDQVSSGIRSKGVYRDLCYA